MTIKEDELGSVDLVDLETQLKAYSGEEYSKRVKIGSFSAASNITGILTDVDRVAILLHKYNFMAFFDYASAAPYVPIDMNPEVEDIE